MTTKKIAWRNVFLSFAVLAVIVCLLVYIFSSDGGDILCKGIDVKIRNVEVAHLVAPEDIKKIIEQSKITGKGKPLNDGIAKKVLKLFESKGSLKDVFVYCTGDSVLHVELEQRLPVLRIMTASGSCYLDKEGIVFPSSPKYAYDVPLVTGKIQLPNEGKALRDIVFAQNLLEFVNFIADNPFWNAQIQQIDIDKDKNVEFVVCSDNHLIRFGQLNGYKDKLENLLTFYKKVNPYYKEKGNALYTVLDLRFNKQIVAVKSN
jgi:cell division protein FtsQ